MQYPTAWKNYTSNSESVELCRTPRGTNNTGSPYMTEDRSTGGVALPAVPPDSDHDHPAGFRPTGCLVELSNLKLPPLGIPPAFSRRRMSNSISRILKKSQRDIVLR